MIRPIWTCDDDAALHDYIIGMSQPDPGMSSGALDRLLTDVLAAKSDEVILSRDTFDAMITANNNLDAALTDAQTLLKIERGSTHRHMENLTAECAGLRRQMNAARYTRSGWRLAAIVGWLAAAMAWRLR